MLSETRSTQRYESDNEEQYSKSCQLTCTRRQETQNDEANKDIPEIQENKEDISLIWFDKNLNLNIKDIKLTKDLLRQINNYVLFFTNQSECLTYIEQVKSEKIILIISGLSTNDDQFLKKIDEFRQIDSLFIFCVEKEKYKQLLSNAIYPKIIGIFSDQETLMRNIRHTIKLIEQQSSVFTLYNHTQKSIRNLTNESGSFIWHQLLKDVLQRMPTNAIAGKREMLDICYKYYRDNKKELQNIQQFEKTYTPNDAIRWYTKDCFLYRLINKALRTEDIEVLYTFRYYINDLSACLGRDYKLWKQRQAETLKLYRDIQQTNDEIQRLQTSIGNLISANGFFSTTKNRKVAEIYAGIGCNNFKYESLLFEIDIDMQTHAHCIFADVSCYRPFADEEEVLFDLGTVFEIVSVEYNSTDQYWTCQMMSTNRGLQIAEEYLTFRKSEMTSEEVDLSVLFGHLLYDMGEYSKSQKYFENLLIDQGNVANIYLGIGHAQCIRGEYREAIKSYKRAYDACDSSDFLLIVKLLNYLGSIYKFNAKYDNAFNCLIDAMSILDKNESGDQSLRLRADIFKNISELYICVGKIIKAMEYAKSALNIIEKLVPCPHLDLAEALTAVALAYREIGDYNTSLQYQIKALEIVKQVLPDNHLYLGVSLNNIGKAYYKKCDYQTAINYLEQCNEIYANIWPEFHQRRSIPLNHLGKSHYRMKNFDQALNYYSQALIMMEKTVSLNHRYGAYTLKNMGEIYLDLSDFDKALDYFYQALNIYKEKFGDNTNQRDIAKCYHLVGQVYLKQNNANRALEYFQLTLNMWETTLVDDHPDLALCTENIAHAYLLKSEYRDTLKYFFRTLNIYEKRPPVNDTKIIHIQNLLDSVKQKINENSQNS